MAIFSVLHLWAFAWKQYAVPSPDSEATDFYGNGKVSYEGGRWGFKALVDAMNPLDLLKAIGRGARWLVVGRKHRTKDPSYQPHNETLGLEPADSGVVNDSTAYEGAGTAIFAGRTGRYGGDEEGAVLLAHAQSNPETAHPVASPYEEDSDDYLHGQPGRFYQQRASPDDESDHTSLREQIPMPIPDPYLPPPPHPE